MHAASPSNPDCYSVTIRGMMSRLWATATTPPWQGSTREALLHMEKGLLK